MTTIKIPSANIYNVDLEDASGKLEQVDVSANKFVSGFGEVLAKEYNIVYWSIDASAPSIFQRAYRGSNSAFNEFVSEKITVTEIATYDLAVYNEDCTLKIGADARFNVNEDKPKSSVAENECYVVRKQHYETYDERLNKTSERDITVKSGANITYDKSKNAFIVSLNTVSITGAEGTFKGTIVATYYADRSAEYLMSETITVESKYSTPEAVEITQGSSVINKFSLPTNELIQERSLFDVNPSGGNYLDIYRLLEELLLPRIIKRYQNGLRVIVIKCSISNYYATSSGQLLICPNDAHFPAVFQLHQFVEPYMFTSKGEVPIGIKADGTPMTFEIIGIDYSYKGVVWQELTIREYIE